MNRRLLLVLVVVVAAGLVRASSYGIARWRAARRAASQNERYPRPSPGSIAPAPSTPPKDNPPGWPFSGRAVSYTSAPPTRESLRGARGSNIVICSLDAARADHFGCYGYPRDTTPNIDRLATEAVVFDQHYCQAAETRPSVASLLTSQYPDTHGITANAEGDSIGGAISASAFTLEKGLEKAGFRTFLLSGNVVVSPQLGVGADFMEQYCRGPQAIGQDESQADGTDSLLKVIAQMPPRLRGSPTPFFAYVHFLPPHAPYHAPQETLALFRGKQPPRYWKSESQLRETAGKDGDRKEPDTLADWINLYDANLRWADSCVAEVVKMLKEAGVFEDTLLIITSDHGEALQEHGYGFHGRCPYDEGMHIPMLIRFPGGDRPVGRVGTLTQTIDILPTIFDLYELPYPRAEVQGESLLPLLAGEVSAANDVSFSRTTGSSAFYVVRDEHSTLVLSSDGKVRCLYDMDADPWQTRDVIAQHPERAAPLEKAFARFARSQRYPPLNFPDPSFRPPQPRTRPGAPLSEETRRQLRALGYL